MQSKVQFCILILIYLVTIGGSLAEDSDEAYQSDEKAIATAYSLAFPLTTAAPKLSSSPASKLGILKQRSVFGESCNKTLKCKSGSWLSCDSSASRCHCTKPDEMIWDEASSKCVVLIGEICRFGIGDGNQLYELAGCVENAFCDLEKDGGTCQCLPSFYENEEGSTCTPKKNHGLQCNINEECNELKRLKCNDNSTCVCENPSTMAVDPTDGICKVKIGSECGSSPAACFSNAACVISAAGTPSKCTCPQGYYAALDDLNCLPVNRKGSFCSRDVECNSTERLSCVNSKCSCDPKISVENMEQFQTIVWNEYGNQYNVYVPVGHCVAKVRSSCTVYSAGRQYSSYPDEIYCIQKAVCNRQNATCECQSDMARTGTNLCGNVHGSSCSESNPCTDNLVCDYDHSRRQSTCKCPNPNHQLYDSNYKKCESKPGATCSPGNSAGCTPNASCLKSKGSKYSCECNSGFVVRQVSRDCDIEYRHPCSQNSAYTPCDQQAGLRCILNYNGTATCLCPDDEDVYEPVKRKCSRGVGLSCSETYDCVQNAVCAVEDAKKELRCTCLNGFEEMEDLSCRLKKAVLSNGNYGSGFQAKV